MACPNQKRIETADRRKGRERDAFHAWMLEDAEFVGDYDIPALKPVNARPQQLEAFSTSMSSRKANPDSFVHFYEDDYRFERLWKNPRAYLPRLSGHAGIIMPDFSTCVDFPRALKIWNSYRNFTLAAWMQSEGLTVVPNVRCEPESDEYSLKPIPKKSTVAIGTRGCVRNRDDRRRMARDIHHAIEYLQPTRVLVYGSDAHGVLDNLYSSGIETVLYPGPRLFEVAED